MFIVLIIMILTFYILPCNILIFFKYLKHAQCYMEQLLRRYNTVEPHLTVTLAQSQIVFHSANSPL